MQVNIETSDPLVEGKNGRNARLLVILTGRTTTSGFGRTIPC